MDDFTKTKLINNLIDLVDYFYESKRKKGSASQIKYLKGFCEGIAHTLVEAQALDSEEAKRILKGIGKKRAMPPVSKPEPTLHETPQTPENTPNSDENKTEESMPKPQRVPSLTIDDIPEKPKEKEPLDVPTIFRKEKVERKSLD